MYFLKNDPRLLVLRMKEDKGEGRRAEAGCPTPVGLFLVGFSLPGLDNRFGVSEVPATLVLATYLSSFLGYLITFFTLQEI
jgi:hypothetical protein